MLRWVGILCVSMAVVGFGLNALGGKQGSIEANKMGADLITIDTLTKFGKLDYPVVRFEHDKHTKAVEGKCESCHTVTGNTVTAKFKRQEDTNAAEIKAIYHDNCLKCHNDTTKAGKKSGPGSEQCRTCHAGPAETSRTPIAFDKSLHYRHSSSKMMLPAPGQKENCSKCHAQDKPEARNLSFAENKDQTHEKCMSCHIEVGKALQPSGPLVCAGCHDATVRAEFKKVADVPRLEAGQSDYSLLMATLAKPSSESTLVKPASEPTLVNAVPFNHKLHEEKNENCSACHHNASSKGVIPCSQCHTSLGKEEGAFITTEQAMHRVTAQTSCVGCHAQAQAKPECAGCHTFMGRAGKNTDASCAKCHVEISAAPELLESKDARNNTASMLMNVRVKTDPEIKVNEIPEIVEISVLANEYQASKFPHRKVVQKIMDGMKDNSMAAYFHSDPNAVCSGCHHNSPASVNPPKCVSCHGKVADWQEGTKPDLKTAYHQQCIGCHSEMGIQKPVATACADCHAVKQ